ncbi:MAG: hypothetical protein KBD78_11535 [Oligoflexales bacterium]|nr:hypothetical protein [Oligoflexales bacterium]
MTIMIDDNQQLREIIADFIIECRGGHFLPYRDYDIIEKWLLSCPNKDQLLLVLAEELPEYFAQSKGSVPRTLTGIQKKIDKKIQQLVLRTYL